MHKLFTALLAVLLVLGSLGGAGAEFAPPAMETAAPQAVAEPTPPPAQDPDAPEGSIRVWLQSLGTREALGLTLSGAYAVDGDRGFSFAPGTAISLGLDGGSIVLKVGGAFIDMGAAFTLTRHLDAQGQAGGAYIHESEKDTLYMGDLAFSVQNGSIRVIVTLHIEEYLYGVVPYEMADHFPLEALKAQAVAARTYAMQRKARGRADYDVADTTNDQVFKGLDDRYATAVQAVNETRGLVGMSGGQYAECFYGSSNGGQTALATDVWGNGDFPYLDIRDDPYDLANPNSTVKTATIARDATQMAEPLYALLVEQVAGQLTEAGEVQPGDAIGLGEVVRVEGAEPLYGGGSRQYGAVRFTIKPAVRRLQGEPGDAVRLLGDIEILETPRVVSLSFYDQVRTALGIGINASRYDLFTVEEADGGFVITNRRYGHGVGMSQWGAAWMAGEHGMTHLDILAFYYPGLELVTLDWRHESLTPIDALPESLGYAAPRPTPAPTPAPLPPLAEGEYYATVTVAGVDGSLNVREGPSMDHPVLGVIRNGARLIIQEELEGGWARMKTAELEGYVSMDFIARE